MSRVLQGDLFALPNGGGRQGDALAPASRTGTCRVLQGDLFALPNGGGRQGDLFAVHNGGRRPQEVVMAA